MKNICEPWDIKIPHVRQPEYQIKFEHEWNKNWVAIRNKESQVLYWILEVKLGWLVRNNTFGNNPFPEEKSLAFIPDPNHTMKEDFVKV